MISIADHICISDHNVKNGACHICIIHHINLLVMYAVKWLICGQLQRLNITGMVIMYSAKHTLFYGYLLCKCKT